MSPFRRRGERALSSALLELHRNGRSSLLVLGGSPAERERLVSQFHAISIVRGRPVVVVDCGSQEADLNGALRDWLGIPGEPAAATGLSRSADQCTLFLQSLGRLTAPTQQLLLMLARRIAAEAPETATAAGPYRLAGGDGEELLDAVERGDFDFDLFDALDKVRAEPGRSARRGAA